jgi:hypothetical protein
MLAAAGTSYLRFASYAGLFYLSQYWALVDAEVCLEVNLMWILVPWYNEVGAAAVMKNGMQGCVMFVNRNENLHIITAK